MADIVSHSPWFQLNTLSLFGHTQNRAFFFFSTDKSCMKIMGGLHNLQSLSQGTGGEEEDGHGIPEDIVIRSFDYFEQNLFFQNLYQC